MSTSWTVPFLCILISFATVSCSTPGYEYYLDKDETHWTLNTISATISSDGTCSFAVNGDDSENYSSMYWTDPENLGAMDTLFGGLCTKTLKEPNAAPQEFVHAPQMFLDVRVPENISSTPREMELLLDVKPADNWAQRQGVYFTISKPQSVRVSLSPFCNAWILYSLKGDAKLVRELDGTVTLTLTALGYLRKDCF